MMTVLLCLPSIAVNYLMICLINEEKSSLFQNGWRSVRSWAYLGFFGGALYTWLGAMAYGVLPHWDKILMDLAALLYFGQRAYRIMLWRKWLRWRKKRT